MSKVIDYAWTQFRGADLKARGYVGAMRYISHDGSKDLSASERDDLRANGLDIGLVFESTSGRATQGGAAGVADANFANDRADSLGYVGTIWYAVDFDGTPTQVQAYFDGVASVGRRLSAPYGSNKIIDGVRYTGVGWQTAAWSNRQVSARAGILQNGFAGDHDDNAVLQADYGQWTVNQAPPTEENVTIYRLNGQLQAVFSDKNGQLRHFWHDGTVWSSGIGSSGNVPGATVGVDVGYEGQLHFLTPRPEGTMQHDWYDTNGVLGSEVVK